MNWKEKRYNEFKPGDKVKVIKVATRCDSAHNIEECCGKYLNKVGTFERIEKHPITPGKDHCVRIPGRISYHCTFQKECLVKVKE